MKRFYFSMQKILDLRLFEQKQAELDLGRANAEVARINRELEGIAKSRAIAVKQSDGLSGDFAFYAQTGTYFLYLEQRQEQLFLELSKATLIAEEKREIVRKAMQNVKVLEKLREKKFEVWKKKQALESELATDDVITASYN